MKLTHIHNSGQSCYLVKPFGKDRSYVVFEEFLERFEKGVNLGWNSTLYQNLVYNNSLLSYDEKLAQELGAKLDTAIKLESQSGQIKEEIRKIFKQHRGG